MALSIVQAELLTACDALLNRYTSNAIFKSAQGKRFVSAVKEAKREQIGVPDQTAAWEMLL